MSEVTRRNIVDELRLSKVDWAGRLDEVKFLSRIFDLSALPSRDNRHKTMEGARAHPRAAEVGNG